MKDGAFPRKSTTRKANGEDVDGEYEFKEEDEVVVENPEKLRRARFFFLLEYARGEQPFLMLRAPFYVSRIVSLPSIFARFAESTRIMAHYAR